MRNDFESNYLMHHGILGQKWGKKNGPPYPLGASDHSASEKKAGWRKSLEDKREMKKAKKVARDYDHKTPYENWDVNKSNKLWGDYYDKHWEAKGKAEYEKRHAKRIANEQKNFSIRMKEAAKKDDKDEERELVGKAVTPEQKKELEAAYKAWTKAYEKEEAFWESKERRNASNEAYDATLKWYEKNDPEGLKSMIKDNNGNKLTLDAYHDFRKMYEGYDDEYTSKAQVKYFKERNINPEAERGAYTTWQSKVDDVTDSLVGKYGNKPIDNKHTQLGYDSIRKITRSKVASMSRNNKSMGK